MKKKIKQTSRMRAGRKILGCRKKVMTCFFFNLKRIKKKTQKIEKVRKTSFLVIISEKNKQKSS
jgi:hypothetical protein